MSKGYVYILQCSDGSYYTGSTIDLEKRISQHSEGQGAKHTRKRLPVVLVYFEEFQRIDDAFRREKQIQGWSRTKKEALINNNSNELPKLSMAYRDKVASSTSATQKSSTSATQKMKTFRSNGKLLLTAEYVVLDGASALAIPTKYGQSLTVVENQSRHLDWKSYDENGVVWFEDKITLDQITTSKSNDTENNITKRLIEILSAAKTLNPEFLKSDRGYTISTHQDFNRKWGLGTSSTLINNIANWANVNPYILLHKTFGGSGYDIACAQSKTPILYQLDKNQPLVDKVSFDPTFKDNLFFVYLNQKQNSRDGIKAYKSLDSINYATIKSINEITQSMVKCISLSDFESLIVKHESIISQLTQQEPVKLKLFRDFNGEIKSLGAWGGDFVLVTSKTNPTAYFKAKGYQTVIPYNKMVLN